MYQEETQKYLQMYKSQKDQVRKSRKRMSCNNNRVDLHVYRGDGFPGKITFEIKSFLLNISKFFEFAFAPIILVLQFYY